MQTRFVVAFTASILSAALAEAQSTPRRRALLIGIDDYTASTLPRPSRANPVERFWPDLKGAANDVDILREMLVHVYGFDPKDIVTLKNQQATRVAILQSIEQHLVQPAAKNDITFYYFAGHGSQVPNPASDELDRLDESIAPADSRWGALDIRDKELRPLFNRILDRGAHLTLILDHCHSGSGFRGLPTGARPRGIRRARELADGKPYGARPEERGALVFASTQDLDSAWETEGEDGLFHGSFSWAWIRALRDAVAGEPAQETFLRAQARLRGETPSQAPVMLGPAEARLRPFLGTRVDRQGDRPIVAVERVEAGGRIVLQGGWANGLAVDTQLRIANDRSSTTRFRITAILGLGRSVAEMEPTRAKQETIRSGALLEVVGWAAPNGRPLRVWAPQTTTDIRSIAKFARQLTIAGKARWLADPLEVQPTHVLRPHGTGWELLDQKGQSTKFSNAKSAIAAIARLPSSSSLFVQFPAPATLIDGIGVGHRVTRVDDPTGADYILVGRYKARHIEYTWMRPHVQSADRRNSALPQQTAWVVEDGHDAKLRDSIASLREGVLKLRRIHAWHQLESPPNSRAPYRLALWAEKTKTLIRNGAVIGNDLYSTVLRASHPLAAHITPRYYYAFVIDSHGRSYLTFPPSGSVENRFPIRDPAPTEIRLGNPSMFRITEPYGADTYLLLSTDEPLPNPSILTWDGVRLPVWTQTLTPLEHLLLLTTTGTRASRPLTTNRWSIERVVFESVAPR
ncbi:MAG: caspase family protein [Acidobacteriota bacterium]|nr:caspase family protein [Acidobacteriota bacterium]